MQIIILGAGRVGESVAETLASEQNDITVIDPNGARLRNIEDRIEVRGVMGDGTQPSVLAAAGADNTDLFIAATAEDAVNLVACKIAHDCFNIPKTIARLRSSEFVEGQALLAKEGFAVDQIICPEASVTRYMHQMIEYPEALQVLVFSQGRAHLVAVRVAPGSEMATRTLAEFRARNPACPMRIVAIYRNDQEVALDPGVRIFAGDEVFFIVDHAAVREAMRLIRGPEVPVRRVMIAGGGRVGKRLAGSLEGQCQVKIIEADQQRCRLLADDLPSDMLVLQGDASDEDLLTDENVGDMDLFVAVTSDDEDNIMSAMLAKRLGARRVMAIVNRRAYADIIQGGAIDIAVSPAQAVIGELLRQVRRGAVAAVHSLRRGQAEALEGIAHGDAKHSQLVGRRIEQIKLPEGARFGAIVRGHGEALEVLMPHHDTEILTDDHLIIFLPHKRLVREVEKLFQVKATFF
jgi:trk system potassium uptake protein TrkA